MTRRPIRLTRRGRIASYVATAAGSMVATGLAALLLRRRT